MCPKTSEELCGSIATILVPQGMEYRAVCQGLRNSDRSRPKVLAIPMGPEPVTRFLKQLQVNEYFQNHQGAVLLMGLCGSLSPQLAVGNVVLCRDCVYASAGTELQMQACDRPLTEQLYSRLYPQASLVRILTSDRLIGSAEEKVELGQQYQADVVDMEGFATLKLLNQASIPLTMLRVVSDDCHHDLPNIGLALDSNGSLQPWPLAAGLLRQPRAAFRLIRGSYRGLRVLQQVTTKLFGIHDLEV